MRLHLQSGRSIPLDLLYSSGRSCNHRRLAPGIAAAGLPPTCALGQHGSSCPMDRGSFSPQPSKDLVVWDLAANREASRLPLDFLPADLCVDSEGRRIAANEDVSQGPRLRIIDVNTRKVLATWTDEGRQQRDVLERRRPAAGGRSRGRPYLRLGHGTGPAGIGASRGDRLKVIRCQFAPGSHLLATSTWDPTTLLWNAATGELLVSAWSSGAFLEFADRRQATRVLRRYPARGLGRGPRRGGDHPQPGHGRQSNRRGRPGGCTPRPASARMADWRR